MIRPAKDPMSPSIEPTYGKNMVTIRGTIKMQIVTIMNTLLLSSLSLKIMSTMRERRKWLIRGKQQNRRQKRATLMKKASILVVPNIIMQFCVISIGFPSLFCSKNTDVK